jgi:hypothetical protein
MRETGKPTFVVSDCHWRARLRARGSAGSRGNRAVSTHGLNTQRVSAVQKVWSSYLCTTILLQHGPTARDMHATRACASAHEFKLDRRCWTGAIWARKLISLLWLAIRAQWDLRNADRHGRTKAAHHAIRRKRLITAITALHQDAPLMSATDRDALDAEPIPVETAQIPAQLELWVHRTRTLATRSKADATDSVNLN